MKTLIIIVIFTVCYILSEVFNSDDKKGKVDDNGVRIPSDQDVNLLRSWLNNYNYRRAVELVQSGDVLQAYEYLMKSLEENPDNAYAHALMGHLHLGIQEYSVAATAFTTAIQNSPESAIAPFFVGRSRAYHGLGDENARLSDISNALDIDPRNPSALRELVEYHYAQRNYEESDKAIDRYLESDPDDVFGYMAKGRNEMERGNWSAALELFEKAGGLADSYSPAWSYKAEALMRLGKYSKAIDSVIKAFELAFSAGEPDDKAIFVRDKLARTAYDLFCIKLKAKAAGGNLASRWLSFLGKVCTIATRYAEAAHWYHKAHELDPETVLVSYEAFCWEQAGNYAKAAGLFRQALREDPDNLKYKQHLTIVLGEQGDYEAAIALCDELIHLHPDMTDSHYNRARFKHILGRYEEAIEDYSTELALKDGDDAKSHFFRGMAYGEIGEVQKSREDYLAITSNADLANRSIVLPLAYEQLGDHDKAVEAWNELEESLGDASSWQLAQQIQALVLGAEFLSRIGEIEKAMERLREALELGSCRFNSYRKLPETSELRKNPCFEELLQEYERKARESWTKWQEDDDGKIPEQVNGVELGMAASLIPFEKEGGVFKVPCKINGLPLHFVFDTGASDVTMSTVEATFMLKNGYLKKQDLCGSEHYMTASGEIAEGTAVRLREVDFGGVKLTNVKASVVRSQNAPLLLGQSVLQRLGRIEIDNVNRVIRVNKQDLPSVSIAG